VTVIVLLAGASCRIKPEQLPFLDYPYLFQMEFLKGVENDNGKARKEYFKDGIVRAPFYFLLTVKELEDEGSIWVKFYDGDKKKVAEYSFRYGEPGKYYEYIICFEKVERILPGSYRYTVFFNDGLIYEGSVTVGGEKKE
jgi:hypothetical protein